MALQLLFSVCFTFPPSEDAQLSLMGTSIDTRETIMADLISREIRLASRPCGLPTAANFTLAHTVLEPLRDHGVLVRNLFMSVDPYMRGRMNDEKSYVPPFEPGKPLDGGAVGDWLDRRDDFTKEGGGFFRDGRLKNTETVAEGIDKAVDAFIGLFRGDNTGKMVVKLL